MKDWESKLESTRLQKESVELKIKSKKEFMKSKIEHERLRHKNIMEEIEAMKKAKITKFSRGETNPKNS